jgi:hypothetical protein
MGRFAPRFEVFMLTATVSGSFHRHMEAITAAVHELAALGVRVLSPADPRIVGFQGEFLFVASDPIRSVRLVQDRHLESIRASAFLWLVCPDGYVGQSASMEIGYAVREGVPIFATAPPTDLTLRQYVKIVPSLAEAAKILAVSPVRKGIPGILIDPRATVEKVHVILERIASDLTRTQAFKDPDCRVYRDAAAIRQSLPLPTHLH